MRGALLSPSPRCPRLHLEPKFFVNAQSIRKLFWTSNIKMVVKKSRADAHSLPSNIDTKKSLRLCLLLIMVFPLVGARGKHCFLPSSMATTNILHTIYNVIICVSLNITSRYLFLLYRSGWSTPSPPTPAPNFILFDEPHHSLALWTQWSDR